MSLADRLETPPATVGNRSPLDTWMDGLTEKDRAALVAAIHDDNWRHIALQREVEAEGAPQVSETTFRAWRRRQARK